MSSSSEIKNQEEQAPEFKVRWIPLESNPDVYNKIIHENGIDPNWSFVDVIGLDDESLATIPIPTSAIIFLFPDTENYKQDLAKQEAYRKLHEKEAASNVVHFRQYIQNACGMIALLHCLANNNQHIVGPGLFKKIIDDTRNMTPEERGHYLEECKELGKIHHDGATHGQSKTPELGSNPNNHFVAFAQVDDTLYEFDGSSRPPTNHGNISGDLLQTAAKVMRKSVERDPNQTFVAMVLAKTGSN